jgi:hypothetical protein
MCVSSNFEDFMTTRYATLSTLCIMAALAGCGDSGTTPSPVAMTPTAPTTPTTGPTTPAPSAGTAGSSATTGVTPPVTTPTNPAAGAAGSGSTPTTMPPVTTPTNPMAGAAGSGAMPPTTMPPAASADPRGKCEINSGYPDDKACLVAPAADLGLQIHVGPKDYKDAADVAKYIQMPGEESSECWTFHTPNAEEVYYQTFELSGRAGTHHIINTMYNTQIADGGFTVCADPGTGTNGNIIDNLPGASKAFMARGIVAPENKNVGRKIPANVTSQADMHYFNFTEKPLIREFWMNVFYAKKEDIKETAAQIRGMGGLIWSAAPIAPGTDMTYKYECPITGNGRILSLLGHYHSHGKHFTASIRRAGGGAVEKVFEMYDYQDPATFEYDTVSKNPAFSAATAGATSGMLEVKEGDVLMWDCHIINDGTVGLTYTNEVKTGEMCNLWGSSLGVTPLNCVLF